MTEEAGNAFSAGNNRTCSNGGSGEDRGGNSMPQQRARFPQKNPYIIDMDRNNRNCYVCGRFGHMMRHCRNRRTGMNRRMEVEQDNSSNLNGKGGLGSSN